MNKFKLYILLFSILLISACGTLAKKAMMIDVGDDKQQVLSALGTPDDRQMNGTQEAWQYCKSGAGFGYNDHLVVWLNNGHVTGITSYKSYRSGCVGQIKQVDWQNAPDRTVELRVR